MDFVERFTSFKKLEGIVEDYAELNGMSVISDFDTMIVLLFNDDYTTNIQFSFNKKGKINIKEEQSILFDNEIVIFDEIIKQYNA